MGDGKQDDGSFQLGELSRDDAFVRLCTLRRKISVDAILNTVRINWEVDEDINLMKDDIYKQFDKINSAFADKEEKLKKQLLSDLMVRKLKAKIDLLAHRAKLMNAVTEEVKKRFKALISREQFFPLACLLIVQSSVRLLEPSPIIMVPESDAQGLNDRLNKIRERIAGYFFVPSKAKIDKNYLPEEFGKINVLSLDMKAWVDSSIMTRFDLVIQDNQSSLTQQLLAPIQRIRLRRYSFSQVFGDFISSELPYPILTSKTFRKSLADQKKREAASLLMDRLAQRDSRRGGSFLKRKPRPTLD